MYLSPLPPPGGGMGTWTRILLARGLPGGWTPVLVDTRLPAQRRPFERGRLGSEALRAARIVFSLLRALLRERPDLVHVNVAPLDPGVYRDLFCVALVRLFRVPVVLQHHGLVARLGEPARAGLRRALVLAARLAALNLVLNEASAAFLRPCTSRAVASIPNFFDETRIPAQPPERRAPGARPRVAFVGPLTAAKGVPALIAAARELPQVEFQLFGAESPELGLLLESAPPNVVARGEVDAATLVAELRRSHVLVLPSEHEGFPLAVAEAMAAGLPVVATPVGAIPEMIEDGRGGTLTSREPERLARDLRALLADEDRRLGQGRFNQEKAYRCYAYGVVAARLVEAYEAVCAPAPAAQAQSG